MDVKFCLFNIALENCQTAQMPPWNSIPLVWNYPALYGYDKWKYGFQSRLPGEFHLKPIKALEKSTRFMECYSFREGLEFYAHRPV